MKILQLCCISNLWNPEFDVESIDIKNGRNVFDLPDDYGKSFNLVCAAPPCDQFTRANALRWEPVPAPFIELALKCLIICKSSSNYWFLETPPGRIEKFIPDLTKYRILTWHGTETNKEYIIYSNFLILNNCTVRYGKKNIQRSKLIRELWQSDFIETIQNSFSL